MLGGIACYGNMVGERPWLNDVIGVLMVLANSLTAQLFVAVIVVDKVVRAARKLDEIKTKLTTERTPAARARAKPSSTVDIGLGAGSET